MNTIRHPLLNADGNLDHGRAHEAAKSERTVLLSAGLAALAHGVKSLIAGSAEVDGRPSPVR